jgi:hypothetical protein
MAENSLLIYKCIDRTQCTDEQLMNLKINIQKEIYCYSFIRNIVLFYFFVTKYIVITELTIYDVCDTLDQSISDDLSIEFDKYEQLLDAEFDSIYYDDMNAFITNERNDDC